MSCYSLTVGSPLEEDPRAAVGSEEYGAIEHLLGALAVALQDAIGSCPAEGRRTLEVRIDTVSLHTTYKQLYQELAEIDGQRVRLELRGDEPRTGILEVPVAALAREMRLDGEEVPWGRVTLVEALETDGRRVMHCVGPAARPWAIAGLLVLTGGAITNEEWRTDGAGGSHQDG